jgi:hypothetical protein
MPLSQKYFELCGETKIFNILAETLPLNTAIMQTLFDVVCFAPINPINNRLDRLGIRHREIDAWVIRGARK